MARRGYWRTLLNQYMREPDTIRAFDRTDDPTRRVNDQTVFVARPSSVCPNRDDVYAAALTDPLAYTAVAASPPAQAGGRMSNVDGAMLGVHPMATMVAPSWRCPGCSWRR